ncbi:MAG: diguanylate cyclase [Abitibacteriaceae bacterium]|nr:diguanylate cyclase [Abditibacteriaceae bacterium]
MEPYQAPGEALGSKPIFRVAIVSDAPAESLHNAQQIHKTLTTAGHQVSIITGASDSAMLESSPPEVLILDVSEDIAAAQELCQQLKAQPQSEDSLVVASLPPVYKAGQFPAQTWEALRHAGADDFLPANAAAAEVEARLSLLTQLARLKRDLAATREQLSRSLQYDELTQLLNRRFFFRAAHREWARARRYNHPMTCLMMDIDYFRLYNSTFGFACGDYVLRTVASILRQWTRESDIVGRFGEEKFVVIIPETDLQGAVLLHEKLQKVIRETEFTWQQQILPVSVSIGESERHNLAAPEHLANDHPDAPGDDEDVESLSVREEVAELLADADAALSVAKKGARIPAFSIDATPHLLGRTEMAVSD